MKDRLLISLGGNAFVSEHQDMTMLGQFEFAARTLAPLADMLAEQQLLITHGNGPQVGYILTRVEEALDKAYALPLEVCVAESEGEIGYVLQQTIHNLMAGRRPVTTLLTQVLVDANDDAFARPTKPIGPWFDAQLARVLSEAGIELVYDTDGRGRRVVASPRPLAIIESDIIQQVLELGIIVIAAGGGGIPVVEQDGQLRGVEAVVDKDLASAMLATSIDAGLLVLVTGVPGVYTDFGKDNAQLIATTTPDELSIWLSEGHFAPGTMGPKVEAAIDYVRASGNRAVICQPSDLVAACRGEAGTVVVPRNHV